MVNGGDLMDTAVKMDIIPDSQLNEMGIQALNAKLGVTGTLRFLEQFDNGGSGDYTKEKYDRTDDKPSKDEILKMFK